MKIRWFILSTLLLFAGGKAISQTDIPGTPPHPRGPQELNYEIILGDKVHLTWEHPVDQTGLEGYVIVRSYRIGLPPYPSELIANVNLATQFTDYGVKSGDQLEYTVYAIYPNGSYPASTAIDIPYPVRLEFRNSPPVTANIDELISHDIDIVSESGYSLNLSISANLPAEQTPVVSWKGDHWNLFWQAPSTPGMYEFTIYAKLANGNSIVAEANQPVKILVTEDGGTITGSVKTFNGKPLPYSKVLVYLFPRNLPDTKIQITTDEDGDFKLTKVPDGECTAYADPENDEYLARYYGLGTLGHSIQEAELLPVSDGSVTHLSFYLAQNLDSRALLSGIVQNEDVTPVENASIHFIRKENYILIGDPLKDDPASIENWHTAIIDTTITTGTDGFYSILLPVNTTYYLVVEKEGYFDCFNFDASLSTNALESRAILLKPNSTPNLTYTMVPKQNGQQTVVSVSGRVKGENDGAGKKAIVFLIEEKLKTNRGTGSGSTYGRIRSVISDSNGVYIFDEIALNKENGNQYIFLAVPIDRDVVPQYYFDRVTGTGLLSKATSVTLTNTIQDIDFKLAKAMRDGLGTVYGRVALADSTDNGDLVNIDYLSGSLVYAVDKLSNRILSYAISDTLGRYSLTGLCPGSYDVYADHPMWGWTFKRDIPITYNKPSDFTRAYQQDLFIIGKKVTTSIDAFDPLKIPGTVELYKNYPNPFNPSTTISFGLHHRTNVRLSVLNSLGQEVQILTDEVLEPGTHSMKFDAANLPSGTYFYQLRADNRILMNSMLLVK